MSLKSIATFSADWDAGTHLGTIVLQRIDGGTYRMAMVDAAGFNAVIADLSAGGPICFDTETLTMTVRYRTIHQFARSTSTESRVLL